MLLKYVDIINTIGVSLILIAFVLLTIRKLKSDSILYYILNFTGAGLACYGSWLIGVIPFVVLEAVWALVAAAGLIRSGLRRGIKQNHPEG